MDSHVQPKFLWSVGYQIFWGMGLRAYRIFGRNVSGQNFFKPFLVVVVLLNTPHQRSDYRHRRHISCADSGELLLITAWVESKYLRSSTHARSSKGASHLVQRRNERLPIMLCNWKQYIKNFRDVIIQQRDFRGINIMASFVWGNG